MLKLNGKDFIQSGCTQKLLQFADILCFCFRLKLFVVVVVVFDEIIPQLDRTSVYFDDISNEEWNLFIPFATSDIPTLPILLFYSYLFDGLVDLRRVVFCFVFFSFTSAHGIGREILSFLIYLYLSILPFHLIPLIFSLNLPLELQMTLLAWSVLSAKRKHLRVKPFGNRFKTV